MDNNNNNKPLKDRYFLNSDVEEFVQYCKDCLKYDIDEAMKQTTTDDLKSIVKDIRKMLNSIEQEIYFHTSEEDEPEEKKDEEKDEGPIVVLMSEQYWARARSFIKAKSMLHGEEPKLMYVTTDPTAFVDGFGSFAYNPDKPFFRVPLGFRVGGPKAGTPGEVEFRQP